MVDFELSDGVTFIRVKRPEGIDAGSSVVLDGLDEAFVRVSREVDVRACVLLGADKYESSAVDEGGALEEAVRCQEVCDRIERCPVPVIAAVEGPAAGCGCELALACHLRIASTRAHFGSTERLARLLGRERAHAIRTAGAVISAEEALGAGLVCRLAAPDQLLAEAHSLARTIAGLAPLAIRACLEAVTRGFELPLEEGLDLEAKLFSGLFSTEDVREGTRAFMEKRAPVFKGK
ncbi:MAG TPA: enoyl-CoA hydratase-related protein [Pyrinomonadaceae bacterium]|jgi:enoyl-CoA hydratase